MSDEMDNVIQLFRDGPGDRIKQRMVEDWEIAFNAAGQSLSQEEAATSLRTAIGVMSQLIRGHHAVGQLTEEQRDSLLWWLGTGEHAADEMQK